MNDRTNPETIVYRAKQLAKEESDPYFTPIESDWAKHLCEEVGISSEVKQVVRRQGNSVNRGKPIGFFFGDDELVDLTAKEDTVDSTDEAEKQRESFIESFQWHAEKVGFSSHPSVPPAVMIPEVTKLLDASKLPNPDDDLLSYVEKKYSEMSEMNAPNAR